jgi:membrane protein YdbS with pleckstrin-like domain
VNSDDQPDPKRRPGYHDPTWGMWGAAASQSALTLRLYLAIVVVVATSALTIWFYLAEAPVVFGAVSAVLAVLGVVDVVVIARRKKWGEPG